jgi:hypothetical protein
VLLRRGDERGVDDLPVHGDVAFGAQRRVDALEQRLDRPRLGQVLAKEPDRADRGDARSIAQAMRAGSFNVRSNRLWPARQAAARQRRSMVRRNKDRTNAVRGASLRRSRRRRQDRA